MKGFQQDYRGFTLIEVLLVVALIAILAAITFVAINPAKNFADTRNAQRSSDVAEILNAVTQYTSEQGNSVDDFGTILTCPGVLAENVATTDDIGTGAVDLDALLVDEFIVGIPVDPSGGTAADTGYNICKTGSRVTIWAPNAENGKSIAVKR